MNYEPRTTNNEQKMIKLPPSPKALPAAQFLQWIFNPLNFLDTCARDYGDIFTMNQIGFEPFVMISHPQGIQEIFGANPDRFEIGRANELGRPLFGNASILLLEGDRHKRERKLLMPPFHGEKIKYYGELICQITEKITDRWQVNRAFIARNVMQEITLEVILNAVFGISEGERYQQLKPLLANMLDVMSSPLRSMPLFLPFLQQDLGSWSPWGKVMHCKRQILALLQAEIEERRVSDRNDGNGKDVLSLMLSARDENGEPLTDEELRDEMVTLLIAGHETTATALAWALYWLHTLPEVRAKLLEEINSLGENPDPMAIARLPYLTAVCQETLRIYPVGIVAFPRITKTPIEIMGYQFEANTWLVPNIYSAHHRPETYPEPKQFKPERFLDRSYSPHEYLPFGGGNRLCIGYALAMLEIKLVLATILSQYDLALAKNSPVKPQRRGGTIAPHNGVPMVMVKKAQKPTSSGLGEQVASRK
ncbi:MAG: cytochrome P450 [Xenococcaceae cyanobacterium]